MRKMQVHEFEQDPAGCLAEVEAGQRLLLIRGGKPVVELAPAAEVPAGQLWKSEDERLEAGKQLMEMMRKGFDLGGIKVTDRDELYDRASYRE